MRVLVTGGSGFIGGHVVAALRAHHEVVAPTHAELDLADVGAVRSWLAAHPVDAVVHAAVKPGHRNAPDPTELASENLREFFALTHCREAFGRFVVIGSGAAYGVQRPLVRVKEDMLGRVVPADEHGLSKYVEAMWLAGDDDAVELRPFGVYGPGEDYAIRFISNACCKALAGKSITLRRDRVFSYVWVDDLAAVVVRALGDGPRALPAGAYNVTPGEPVSLRTLANLVAAAAGVDTPVVVAEEGMGLEYSGDGSRLAQALPDLRSVTASEGIERLLSWYGRRLQSLDLAVLEADR